MIGNRTPAQKLADWVAKAAQQAAETAAALGTARAALADARAAFDRFGGDARWSEVEKVSASLPRLEAHAERAARLATDAAAVAADPAIHAALEQLEHEPYLVAATADVARLIRVEQDLVGARAAVAEHTARWHAAYRTAAEVLAARGLEREVLPRDLPAPRLTVVAARATELHTGAPRPTVLPDEDEDTLEEATARAVVALLSTHAPRPAAEIEAA